MTNFKCHPRSNEKSWHCHKFYKSAIVWEKLESYEFNLNAFWKTFSIYNWQIKLGNDNYARKLYREASKNYRKSIYLLDNTSVKDEAEEARWKAVMLKLYLNMSAVCLKQSKPKKCIFYCKLALDFEPNNVKSLFRYGQASLINSNCLYNLFVNICVRVKSLRILQDFDRSRKFLVRAYNLDPSNKDIANEIQRLNEFDKCQYTYNYYLRLNNLIIKVWLASTICLRETFTSVCLTIPRQSWPLIQNRQVQVKNS